MKAPAYIFLFILMLLSCKKNEDKQSTLLDSSFEFLVPDTLRKGRNVARIINYKPGDQVGQYLITVIVDNHYTNDSIVKDTFSDGTLNPYFGIYGHKNGNQRIKVRIEEKILIDNNLEKDSSSLYILEKFTNEFLDVYVADENYISELGQKLIDEVNNISNK